MLLSTATPNYRESDVMDISANSQHVMDAGRCLSPTPQLEKARRTGAITVEQFHKSYVQLIRERYQQDKSPFLWLLIAPQLTLTCDNHKIGECHCQDAVNVLKGIAQAYHQDFVYCGERDLKKSKADYHDRPNGWSQMPLGVEF